MDDDIQDDGMSANDSAQSHAELSGVISSMSLVHA